MPYIIMKRDDIPAGVLQVLDMDPNTSLRNYTLDVPGQTKYVDPVQNDEVVLMQPGGGGTPIIFRREARGLAAWFATNVNDGTGAFATGSFTVLFAAPIIAGDTVTITNAGTPYVFTAVAGPRTPGANDFSLSTGTDIGIAVDLAAAINDPLNHGGAVVTIVTAVPAAALVTITANAEGTAGNAIVLSSSNVAGFSPVGLAGGVDADALTAAEANGNAAAVLGLLAFGDLTSAAGVLTLAAINGALVTGTITATQLTQVLDILAGRQYFVPNNTQVDSNGTTFDVQPPVGTTGGPWFIPGSLRPLFLNDGLPLSFTMGELLGYTDSGFVYGGVAGNPNGEAVVVYNDDGTFFTP